MLFFIKSMFITFLNIFFLPINISKTLITTSAYFLFSFFLYSGEIEFVLPLTFIYLSLRFFFICLYLLFYLSVSTFFFIRLYLFFYLSLSSFLSICLTFFFICLCLLFICFYLLFYLSLPSFLSVST